MGNCGDCVQKDSVDRPDAKSQEPKAPVPERQTAVFAQPEAPGSPARRLLNECKDVAGRNKDLAIELLQIQILEKITSMADSKDKQELFEI